jgi:hypothetical protein
LFEGIIIICVSETLFGFGGPETQNWFDGVVMLSCVSFHYTTNPSREQAPPTLQWLMNMVFAFYEKPPGMQDGELGFLILLAGGSTTASPDHPGAARFID